MIENSIAIGSNTDAASPKSNYNIVAVGFHASVGQNVNNSMALGNYAYAKDSNSLVLACGDPIIQIVIHSDGRVELPETWSAEKSSQEFWKAIAGVSLWKDYTPQWIKSRGSEPQAASTPCQCSAQDLLQKGCHCGGY